MRRNWQRTSIAKQKCARSCSFVVEILARVCYMYIHVVWLKSSHSGGKSGAMIPNPSGSRLQMCHEKQTITSLLYYNFFSSLVLLPSSCFRAASSLYPFPTRPQSLFHDAGVMHRLRDTALLTTVPFSATRQISHRTHLWWRRKLNFQNTVLTSSTLSNLYSTSSSAIAYRVGQFWPKVKDDILQTV